MSDLTFVLSDTVAREAASAFTEQRRRILERLPHADVRHRGGTSIAGVLTAGDVDVHVRVGSDSFEAARAALTELYHPFHMDMWSTEGAFFTTLQSNPTVEFALTEIGSSMDLHHGEAWDRIAADGALVEQYNTLKRDFEGGSPDDYRVAKRTFFYEILRH